MRWILLCLLAVQAATCGQKGPLTNPALADQAAAVTAPHAATVTTGRADLRS